MKYHDYKLQGYSVTDYGKTILLDLIYDYPDSVLHHSTIEFSEVTLYHFHHTQGAIITDIEEISIEELVADNAAEIMEWDRMLGVIGWNKGLGIYEDYPAYLKNRGYSGWIISSAIGFFGFVIGKNIRQKS